MYTTGMMSPPPSPPCAITDSDTSPVQVEGAGAKRAVFTSWSVTSSDSEEGATDDAVGLLDRVEILPPNWKKYQPLNSWAKAYRECVIKSAAESDAGNEPDSELYAVAPYRQQLKRYYTMANRANSCCPPWATHDEFMFTDRLAIYLTGNRDSRVIKQRCTSMLTGGNQRVTALRKHFVQYCRGAIDYQYMADYFHRKAQGLESEFPKKHPDISLREWQDQWRLCRSAEISDILQTFCQLTKEPEVMMRMSFIAQLKKGHPAAAHDFLALQKARTHSTCCFARAQQMLLWLDIASFPSGFDWPQVYAALKDQISTLDKDSLSLSVDGLLLDTPCWYQQDIHQAMAAWVPRQPVGKHALKKDKPKAPRKAKRLGKKHTLRAGTAKDL